MSARSNSLAICLSILFSSSATLHAWAVAPVIKDDAKFFSPDVVKKANEEIRDMARKYGKDILVETIPTVAADQLQKVKAMSTKERATFFHTWAAQRMDETAVNGVYILVCKEPAHVRVEISSKSSSGFDQDFRDKLSRILVTNFREKHFNEGLEAAIKLVREKLADSK